MSVLVWAVAGQAEGEFRGYERQMRTVIDLTVMDLTAIDATQSRSQAVNVFLTIVSSAGGNPRI